jgi:Family of unknown function (DUF6153)
VWSWISGSGDLRGVRAVTAPATSAASTASVRRRLRRASSPLDRWPVLLVFGLLIGLVGMHGLVSGGSSVVGAHHSSAVGVHLGMPDMRDMRGEPVCRSDSGDGGHAQHADTTCASGALGAGPGLPALLPTPLGPAAAPGGGHRSAAVGQEGGRAPPSLSELQLLRI